MNNNELKKSLEDVFIRFGNLLVSHKENGCIHTTTEAKYVKLMECVNGAFKNGFSFIDWDNLTEENLKSLHFSKLNINEGSRREEKIIWLIPIYLYDSIPESRRINNTQMISVHGHAILPNEPLDTTVRHGCLGYGILDTDVIKE